MSEIADRLNRLVDAIEALNVPMSDYLLPGLSSQDIDQLTESLDFRLPEGLYELYAWHNGHEADIETPLFFDKDFISLQDAMQEYHNLRASLQFEIESPEGHYPYLKTCFPFAEFEGDILVLMSEKESFEGLEGLPVISVFEGVEVAYDSFLAMLDAAIEDVPNNINLRC